LNLRTLIIYKTGSILISIAVIILGAMTIIAPADVEGAEFRFQPGITLSEEYNDNVFLTTENRSDDYITAIAPSLSIVYLAPSWDWNVSYNYNLNYYAKKTRSDDSSQSLNLANKNRIISDVLFLDLSDRYSRVSLDVLRDYTQESNFVNQSDMNSLTINPYLVVTPLSRMTVTTGYIFTDTWYKDPLAIGRTDQVSYVDIRQDITPRSALLAGARHTLDINAVEGYTEDDLYLGLYHDFGGDSVVTAKAGKTWSDFEITGRTTAVFWEGTITQRWPTVTVTYETGVRLIPDPLLNLRREDRYLVTISKDFERTSLMVSGGLIEYREAHHNNLENTSYRLTGVLSHALTEKSRILLNLTTDRLDDNQAGTSTERYLADVRLEHQATEKLTLALDYRYTNAYSPDISSVNYFNNRFLVELRMVF
jgi:hypothetical protein